MAVNHNKKENCNTLDECVIIHSQRKMNTGKHR